MKAMKLLSIFTTCVYSSTKISRATSYREPNETKITKGPTIYFERQVLALSCGAHAIDNLYQTPGLLFDNARMCLEQRVTTFRSEITDPDSAAHFYTDEELWKQMYADNINQNYDFSFIEWLMETLVTTTGVTVKGTLDVNQVLTYQDFVDAIMAMLEITDGVLIWKKNINSTLGHFYTIRKFGNYWYLLDSQNRNPIKYDNPVDLFIKQIKPLYNPTRMHVKLIAVNGANTIRAMDNTYPTLTHADSILSNAPRKYVAMI